MHPVQTYMLVKIALYPVGKEVSHIFFNMETLQEAHLSIMSHQNQNIFFLGVG